MYLRCIPHGLYSYFVCAMTFDFPLNTAVSPSFGLLSAKKQDVQDVLLIVHIIIGAMMLLSFALCARDLIHIEVSETVG